MGGARVYAKERLRIAVRTSDGHAFVRTLRTASGFEGRMEPVVVGDNAIFPNTGTYRLGDFPTADFGLRYDRSRPGFFEAPASQAPQAATLPLIAAVSAVDVPYRLERFADDTIYGRPMYHLGLSPLRERGHNVLREMWVDRETFEPRRYVAERFVGSPALFSYNVTVDEARIAGFMINTNLTGRFESQVLGHIGVAGEVSSSPRIRTTDAAWSVSDISFPEALPAWLFDPSAFRAHKDDALPAALDARPTPPSLPSLRHLMYDVTLVRNATGSDAPVAPTGASPIPNGSALQGRILINVVAATGDDGLVVDVNQTSNNSLGLTRVAIASDGALFYDVRVQLTTEEIALLRLFGRSVIGPTVRRPGDTWQVPAPAAGVKENASFRVVGIPAPDNEVLDVRETYAPSNAIGSGGSLRGILTYNPALSVPLSASFVTRMDIAEGGSRSTILTTVTLQLVEDSFAVEPNAPR